MFCVLGILSFVGLGPPLSLLLYAKGGGRVYKEGLSRL
jgi:hypothetical protein